MLYADILVSITACTVLLYGAVWDARKRIIPNIVPIILSLLGALTLFLPHFSYWQIPLSERIAGFLMPTITMLILHAHGKPVGGGDFKLSAALGLLFGLPRFALIYTAGGIIALIWAIVKKQKSVPLAVFLTIGVFICLMI